MLEDDPNNNTIVQRKSEKELRWGPKHKGAQTLAKFYSSGN